MHQNVFCRGFALNPAGVLLTPPQTPSTGEGDTPPYFPPLDASSFSISLLTTPLPSTNSCQKNSGYAVDPGVCIASQDTTFVFVSCFACDLMIYHQADD